MAITQEVLSQLETAHARSLGAQADFAVQHSNLQLAAAQNDSRLMNGFLAAQLFSQELVQAKSAFHTPVEPQAAPLPSTPAK